MSLTPTQQADLTKHLDRAHESLTSARALLADNLDDPRLAHGIHEVQRSLRVTRKHLIAEHEA